MLSAIIGMLSAINRNHCPQSIGTPVRNRRNPQSLLSTAKKQGWNMLETLAADPKRLIANLRMA
jgi:hypothetical protein